MSTCKRMWTDREIRSMAVDSVENKSNLKVFENIVDKAGHKRFIEGDVALDENVPSSLTFIYGKWTLSGSHLMIVLSYKIADATTTGYIGTLATINLPDWIKSKIVALGGTTIASKNFDAFGADDTAQSVSVRLRKSGDSIFMTQSSVTTTAERTVRVEFDLVIDNN